MLLGIFRSDMKAFPQKYPKDALSPCSQSNPVDTGMDLRDYFAAKIALNMNWEGTYAKDWEKEASDNLRAKRVYEIADAMMKARNQ